MEVSKDRQLCVEVSDRGSYFMESGQCFDCKFLVGAEPHQVLVAGHKLVLAMASPAFEAMFYGLVVEERDRIPIPDIQPEIFRKVLRYIYTGRLNLNSVDEAIKLLYAAKSFTLEHLVDKCDRYLRNHVTAENVWNLYKPSLLGSSLLSQKCEQIICMNTKNVLSDSNFENVDLNTVVAVFSLDTLNIDSELDLIEAAATYAKAQSIQKTNTLCTDDAPSAEQNGSRAPVSNDEVLESFPEASEECQDTVGSDVYEFPMSGSVDLEPVVKDKSVIREVTKRICFLSLTPQQFTECSSRNLIMTSFEEEAVKMNIESNICDVAMPEGFSKRRIARHRMFEVGSPNVDETRAEATFRYTVQDFKNVKDLWSPSCYVRNLAWQLRVMQVDYINTDGQLQKHSKFSIRCSGLNNSTWSCNATATLTLMSQRQGINNHAITLTQVYNSEKNTGYFTTASIALSQEVNYIKEGAITVQVHIKVDTPQETHPKSSVWW